VKCKRHRLKKQKGKPNMFNRKVTSSNTYYRDGDLDGIPGPIGSQGSSTIVISAGNAIKAEASTIQLPPVSSFIPAFPYQFFGNRPMTGIFPQFFLKPRQVTLPRRVLYSQIILFF
jgi:hypothetical protein